MTLSMAWVRKVNTIEELIIATDSRLRAGYAWDCAPKIFPLARGDCAICFAGDTSYAYPIMEQFRNAISMHLKTRSRALDVCDLRGRLLSVAKQMGGLVDDLPRGKRKKDPPDVQFIFAGYSWKRQGFRIWVIYYNAQTDQFEVRTPVTLHKNKFCAIGDDIQDAKRAILNLCKSRGVQPDKGFDMEPFEVLRDFCRDPARKHIGGAPQIVKVYKHMNNMPYAVLWPNGESNELSLLGRPLLDYEKPDYLSLDPDTLITS